MAKVFVLGATGRQGGAVTRQLLDRGHEVSAQVRDVRSQASARLASWGAILVEADLRDHDALAGAIAGHDAVFGLSIPFGAGGMDEEVRAGRALIDAAAETHLVYSSVRGADRVSQSGVDHADSKQLIEQYLRDRATPATVIGPVYFMENALHIDFSGLRRGVLSTPLSPHKRLDQVAVDDIAAMATYAIEHPDEMIGRRVEVASDSVTGAQAAEILSGVIGRDIPYEPLPLDVVRQYTGEEFVAMWQAFEANDDFVDIASLRAAYPSVAWHTYESWALSVDWDAVLSAPPAW